MTWWKTQTLFTLRLREVGLGSWWSQFCGRKGGLFEADVNLFVQGCNQTKRLVRSGLSRSQHETPFRPIHRRGDEGRDGWLENRGGRRYNGVPVFPTRKVFQTFLASFSKKISFGPHNRSPIRGPLYPLYLSKNSPAYSLLWAT